ncbi:hypothetical protein ILUMI_10051 [Ignelater luminosus]|uniref:Uncharacterized protein n=1 Tax=Ignelater luminosus TaxID=2038154 RepID=A0A8K0D307_IGNLU|nr:hypothetical protein ILUMI_10051 [Ignelater luminosus]
MKVLIIVSLVLAVTLQADARVVINQDLPKVLRETAQQSFACASQLGPDAAKLPKIENINSSQLPEDNPVLNRLWGCLWEKKGFIDKEGVVYPEKLKTYLVDLLSISPALNIDVEDTASKVTNKCKDVEGSDYKVKSIKMQNCITKSVSEFVGTKK